jgi:hypothetical protein
MVKKYGSDNDQNSSSPRENESSGDESGGAGDLLSQF